ncbi:MAG: phosphate acyltransferase PlsX [Bdellovibrionota bacterium]
MERKRIAVDVMGGDLGSSVVIKGTVRAAKDFNIPIILVGIEEEIFNTLKEMGETESELIKVQHSPDVIAMEESPSLAIRGKRKASIRVVFETVKEGRAFGVMSPGNTGAMMAAGLAVCGTLPGIQRPAIATRIPRIDKAPLILLDSGANIDCNRNQLIAFALMGSVFASVAYKIDFPRVALLSNGEELCKGTDIIRSTALYLSKKKDINFIGYVEGRGIIKDMADVVVCDGFVGNIVLKTMEGMVSFIFDLLKVSAKKRILGSIGLFLAKPVIKSILKEKLKLSENSTAPLLGLNIPAMVLHGASKEEAFYYGLKSTSDFVEANISEIIKEALLDIDFDSNSYLEADVWKEIESDIKRKRERGKENE